MAWDVEDFKGDDGYGLIMITRMWVADVLSEIQRDIRCLNNMRAILCLYMQVLEI
jgi:hypothetical protein